MKGSKDFVCFQSSYPFPRRKISFFQQPTNVVGRGPDTESVATDLTVYVKGWKRLDFQNVNPKLLYKRCVVIGNCESIQDCAQGA